MPVVQTRLTLTAAERAEKQRLLMRDLVALSSLLAIVVVLSFVTYGLFHSFARHRLLLEERWKQRAELALRDGQPQRAVESLRSALAYAPDDRELQIELARALAAAGRTQEAVVYFTTLHEVQPGEGMINLELARLAARQGQTAAAIEDYEAALDGTWNGDGFLRRREVRLELSRYLIAQHRFDEARNQLLIAAGNAADNHALQLTAAGLLEQAEGDADAYGLYRKAAAFRDTRTAALVGAGRTAGAQGRYLLARNLLNQAAAQPDYGRLPEAERAGVHSMLEQAKQVLVLYPSTSLPLHERAARVAHAAQLARARLAACDERPGAVAGAADAATSAAGSGEAQPGASATGSGADTAVPAQDASAAGALRSALGAVASVRDRLARPAAGSAGATSPAAAGQPGGGEPGSPGLAALSARWQQLAPAPALLRAMERSPALLESTLALVYETEKETAKDTAQSCGAPSGEDALLLRIAQAPDEIEQP